VLSDIAGNAISIQGLWGLIPGNGGNGGDANAIYFAAGIGGGGAVQSHGLFGSLQAAPMINPNGIVNGASFQIGSAPYTYISILGSNLAATTRQWQTSDFVNGKLPQVLDGVSVSINNTPAYVAYVSPTQLNVLLPTSAAPGQLQTVNNGLNSAPTASQFIPLSPAFFQLGSSNYVAATHADGSLIGPDGMFSSTTKPARAGEVITLYGNGFGATTPAGPDGMLITSPLPLVTPPVITFGGVQAQVVFAGVTAPGLYQFNVVVPQAASGNNVTLMAQIGPLTTPAVQITIQ
jgi:uncharacterized protein (TIGR03437 family)